MRIKQKITPFLWFDNKAEEAANYYVSIFPNSTVDSVSPMAVTFTLEGQPLFAINGGPHFKLTEAFSLYVNCESQQEVDTLWNKFIDDGGEASRCGWLKDKYGLSWQIIPSILQPLLGDTDRVKAGRAMQAMLKMQKLDIKGLQDAFDGK